MKKLLAVVLFSQLCISAIAQNSDKVLKLADPAIFSYKGTYYLYGTGEPDGFKVYTSTDLKNWKVSAQNAGYALKKGEAFGEKGFWAPQVFEYKKKFYMAYVADEMIAIAESSSPLGPFTQRNKIAIPSSTRQIDPFIYMENGKVYMYHVRLTEGNRIFVAELSDDLSTIKEGTLKECLSAQEKWENTANAKWPVSEGPTVLKRNGIYYLIYSANDFRNPDYAVGYATSNSPTGPWKKYAGNPIISRSMLGINGPGHGDVFYGKNNEMFYVLHAHLTNDRVSPRKTPVISMKLNDSITVDPKSFHYLEMQ